MMRLAVLLLLAGPLFAEEAPARIPPRLPERCVPLGATKANMRLDNVQLEHLLKMIGTIQCVQFEFPEKPLRTEPLDLPKQEVTGDQLLAWLLEQLTKLGYQVTPIGERMYRCQQNVKSTQ